MTYDKQLLFVFKGKAYGTTVPANRTEVPGKRGEGFWRKGGLSVVSDGTQTNVVFWPLEVIQISLFGRPKQVASRGIHCSLIHSIAAFGAVHIITSSKLPIHFCIPHIKNNLVIPTPCWAGITKNNWDYIYLLSAVSSVMYRKYFLSLHSELLSSVWNTAI